MNFMRWEIKSFFKCRITNYILMKEEAEAMRERILQDK